MRKLIVISILTISTSIFAQVSIGKSSVEGDSTILDFTNDDDSNNTNNNIKGIILSAVNSAPSDYTSSNNGTFLVDKTDKKVKMYQNNNWVNLTDEGDLTSVHVTSSTENDESGIIIGSETSQAEGVLVLESTDKAMILPRIYEPNINVKNPYPGMMCYDTKSKTVAIYDGLVWNFWK